MIFVSSKLLSNAELSTASTITTQPTNIQVDCAWSPWLNVDSPDNGAGDIESIGEIKRKFGVCNTFAAIECKVTGTPVLFSQAGQDRLTCDILSGFRCYNSEQVNGKCMDYEVRILCWDSLCPGPSPKPPTLSPPLTTLPSDQAVRTTGSCPPGEEWQSCAYTCDEVCDYLGRSAGGCNGILTPEANCIPGCREPPELQTVTCKPDERLIDTNTCVPKSLCTCLKPDGTAAKAFESWIDPDRPCSVCSCFSGEVICSVESCQTTLPAPGVTAVPPTQVCGWSNWINENSPGAGKSGDLELLSVVGPPHGLCASPSRIMCRDTQTGLEAKDGNQVVKSDLVDGFKCFDYQNPQGCHDYEISVYCGCLPTPEPDEGTFGTPTPAPELSSFATATPAPDSGSFRTPSLSDQCVSGWSPWLNRDTPTTNDGDIEKMTKDEMATFCPGGNITEIQCIDSDSLDDWVSLSEASCTVEDGLKCVNLPFLYMPSCRDYKIRYMCNCSAGSVLTKTTPMPAGNKEPKCEWTAWMDSQAPDALGEEESISMLRSDFSFCKTADITAVECRDRVSKKTAEQLGQANVLCDLQFEGLKCFSADQPSGQCADYEVRFFCEPQGLDCGANGLTTLMTTTTVSSTPHTLSVCNGSSQDAMPVPVDASQITASSSLSAYSGPERALLDTQQEMLKTGGWVAQKKRPQPVDQSQLSRAPKYSSGQPQVFTANIDSDSKEKILFMPVNAKAVMLQPLSWHNSIAVRLQILGCEPSSQPTNSLTPSGATCISGWSPWLNRDTPATGDGDVENMTPEELATFCPGGNITDIQCIDSDSLDDWVSLSEASCTVEDGLQCVNLPFLDMPSCRDYKIRYMCNCSESSPNLPKATTEKKITTIPAITTRSMTTSKAVTTVPDIVCRSGWSSWINEDTPATGDGDVEKMAANDLDTFCPGGNITDIQCVDSDSLDDWVSLSEASCTVEDGLQCVNLPFLDMPSCRDYKIRYMCNCTDASTLIGVNPSPQDFPASPSSDTSKTTTLPKMTTKPTAPPVPSFGDQCVSGWLPWLNRDIPVTGDGDFEKMTPQELDTLCPGGQITDIDCIDSDSLDGWASLAEASCTLAEGLQCFNLPFLDAPSCRDYKIRYMCDCGQPQGRRKRSVSQSFEAPAVPFMSTMPANCQAEMGMRDRSIHNNMISASSSRDDRHAAHTARLGTRGTWIPAQSDIHQYIQVDFLGPVYLSGVTTQGQADGPSLVTSYKIQYSKDGVIWNIYKEHAGVDKIFKGNPEPVTPVSNFFHLPILTRFLRISPQTWRNRIALRFEVHGCPQQYHALSSLEVATLSMTDSKSTSDVDAMGDCLEWDTWVDTHHPSLSNKNDIATINELSGTSPTCKYPIAIECRTATPDNRPAKAANQGVVCNLWDGLMCNASKVNEPICFNYEVRLGCLKNTPECVSEAQMAPHSAMAQRTCYADMDTSGCPKAGCAKGLFCNGQKCVPKTECPCNAETKVLKPDGVFQETICLPKEVPTCPLGQPILDKEKCTFSCAKCDKGELQCGDGTCLLSSKRCDGIIDCLDDELECSTAPIFNPWWPVHEMRPSI
ncbi:hypothetical protein RRG08_026853 [Elysia crispata]|uniref:F5/8 type C domain-containing protein n=1 Tax=Elysia crispata TaxID=231223 RepID=A0AAE0Y5G0_9GAST|nr:hypothetical protein RRG08_026853 [Elysia crispata]